MLNSTERQFTILFALFVLLELITAQVPNLELAHYLAKPAIVFSLIVLVINQKSVLKMTHRFLLILALGFSVTGDILLMFVPIAELYFITGLVSFHPPHRRRAPAAWPRPPAASRASRLD